MALYTKLTTTQINKLISPFNLLSPKKITGIVEGTVNTYYRLDYEEACYYLKVDEVGDKKRLQNELVILQLLSKLKLSFKTPEPLFTKTKKSFIPFQKKFILIFKELKGKTLTPTEVTPLRLSLIAQALATLHQKTKDNKKIGEHRFNTKGLLKVFKEIKEKTTKKHPHLIPLLTDLLTQAKNADLIKLPSGLIHADLFPENILFEKNNLTSLLDFEAAGFGPFLFDVGVCLNALCQRNGKIIKKQVQIFLKEYTKIRPFTKIEQKNFKLFWKISALRFLLTRLRDFELKEGAVKASPFKDYREYVTRMDEIDLF